MPLPLPPRKNELLLRRFLAPLCPPAPPPLHPDDAIMRSTGRKEDRWRRGSRLDEVPMSHAVFRLPPPTHLTEPPPPGPIAAPRRSSPATTPPHLCHTARPRRCALPTLPPCRTIHFRASPFVPRCCASPATFTTAAPYLTTMHSMTGLLKWSRQSACSEGGRAHEGRWWQVLAACMPGATWIRVWHATAPVHHERRRRDGRCAPLPEPAPGHPIPFYSPTPTTLPATQHHLPLTNFGEAISCCLPLRSCMPGLPVLPKVFDRMLKQKLKGTNVLVRGRWLAGLIVVLYPHQQQPDSLSGQMSSSTSIVWFVWYSTLIWV